MPSRSFFLAACAAVNLSLAATCRDLGAPNQLTKVQVAEIKSKNSGAPLEVRTLELGSTGQFTQHFKLRENDAVLITLTPQR